MAISIFASLLRDNIDACDGDNDDGTVDDDDGTAATVRRDGGDIMTMRERRGC